MINGIPGHPIEDVTLENIQVAVAGGGDIGDADVVPLKKEPAYPDCVMFGPELPAYGVFARHARGLKLTRCRMDPLRPDGPTTPLHRRGKRNGVSGRNPSGGRSECALRAMQVLPSLGGTFLQGSFAHGQYSTTLCKVLATKGGAGTPVLISQAVYVPTPFRYVRFLGPGGKSLIAEMEFYGHATP